MTRTLVLLPFVMFCGALLGLMIGGLWVQLQIGADMARADPFILVESFSGWSGILMQPWLAGPRWRLQSPRQAKASPVGRSGGNAQELPFANSAFRLDLAIHHAAMPRVKADAGR